MKNVFFVTLFLLFICRSQATTYYVENSAGLDANAGTSTAAPWQHCPGDQKATGNPASTTLSPGDIVVFHGGVTYSFPSGQNDYISVSTGGTSGNPITYISGDQYSPQWGTTPAFINGANATEVDGSVYGIFSIYNIGWITFNGFVIANATQNDTYSGCIGGQFNAGAGNISILNCAITNSTGSGIFLQGSYGYGVNPSGIMISNCLIHDTGFHGIFLRGGWDKPTITGCNIYNTGKTTPGAGGDDIALSMFDETPPEDNMTSVVISNNMLGSSITKSDILFGISGTGITVVNNIIYGTNQVCDFDLNGTVTNVLFANNLITNWVSELEGIWRFDPDFSFCVDKNIQILNNTCPCFPSYVYNDGAFLYFEKDQATGSTLYYNVTFENNIVQESTVPLVQINAGTVDMATFVSDYNVWNPHNPGANNWFIGGTGESGGGSTLYTFATWQSTFSQDAHSTTSIPSLNAALVPLATDAVANQRGANTSGSGVTIDKNGAIRTTPYTIGAYNALVANILNIVAGNSGLNIVAGQTGITILAQ